MKILRFLSTPSFQTRFILLILLSPGFWWTILQPKAIATELKQASPSFIHNISSKLHPEYQTKIIEMRWGGQLLHRDDFISRIIYNKSLIVLNEFFDLLQFATPRLYFLAGDGSNFSPPRIEPIATPLFFFWLLGIGYAIKHHRFTSLIIALVFSTIGFLVGRKTLVILMPVLISYIYIANLGIESVSNNLRKFITILLLIYSAYLIDMSLWFRNI